MIESALVLAGLKHAVCAGAIACIAFAPAWLAEKNNKDNLVVVRVRASAWIFGWTIIGYFVALYIAAKK
jgi:hypothetical protein